MSDSSSEQLAPADAGLQVAISDTARPRRKSGQRGKALTGYEVADILRWSAQGLTQEQIARRFDPPKAQSTISDIITRYSIDRTVEAKAILRSQAPAMALDIVKKGRPADKVAVLKGLSVLDEGPQQGFAIHIGVSSGDVKIGILSPQAAPVQSESLHFPSAKTSVSDK